jgi:hypothetical protein
MSLSESHSFSFGETRWISTEGKLCEEVDFPMPVLDLIVFEGSMILGGLEHPNGVLERLKIFKVG